MKKLFIIMLITGSYGINLHAAQENEVQELVSIMQEGEPESLSKFEHQFENVGDANALYKGNPLIVWAVGAKGNPLGYVKTLVKLGADVNKVGTLNMTALQRAEHSKADPTLINYLREQAKTAPKSAPSEGDVKSAYSQEAGRPVELPYTVRNPRNPGEVISTNFPHGYGHQPAPMYPGAAPTMISPQTTRAAPPEGTTIRAARENPNAAVQALGTMRDILIRHIDRPTFNEWYSTLNEFYEGAGKNPEQDFKQWWAKAEAVGNLGKDENKFIDAYYAEYDSTKSESKRQVAVLVTSVAQKILKKESVSKTDLDTLRKLTPKTAEALEAMQKARSR